MRLRIEFTTGAVDLYTPAKEVRAAAMQVDGHDVHQVEFDRAALPFDPETVAGLKAFSPQGPRFVETWIAVEMGIDYERDLVIVLFVDEATIANGWIA